MLRNLLEELADVVRDDIGATLATAGIDAQVEPRLVLSPSESPCIDIFPGAPSRDAESAGFGDISGFYVLTVRVRVTAADAEEMQDLLMDMIDDGHDLCVAAAIVSDQTLGGYSTGVFVDPDGFSGLLDMSTATQSLVGCTWRVLVGEALS